jgi:hypothetical protein
MAQDEHDALVVVAWRYAALCGITDHSDLVSDEEFAEDQKRFSHLIKVVDGLPMLDDLEGAGFMAESSGMPFEDCRKVLLEVWEG